MMSEKIWREYLVEEKQDWEEITQYNENQSD